MHSKYENVTDLFDHISSNVSFIHAIIYLSALSEHPSYESEHNQNSKLGLTIFMRASIFFPYSRLIERKRKISEQFN